MLGYLDPTMRLVVDLFRSIPESAFRQALTIVQIYAIYRPFEFFAWPGTVLGSGQGLRITCCSRASE